MPRYTCTLVREASDSTAHRESKKLSFWANNIEHAYEVIEENWRNETNGEEGWFGLDDLQEHKERGGLRPNAGRRKNIDKATQGKKPQTVVKRLPIEVAEKLEKLLDLENLLIDYQERASRDTGTSPRWDKLREFLADAQELGF